MTLESAKYLHDIREAADRVLEFTHGADLDRYVRDSLLRSAVERQLEIAGEALVQLARRDPAMAGRISEYSRIIAFRNILVHGYADVDSRVVWDIVTTKLGTFRREVDMLLGELEA